MSSIVGKWKDSYLGELIYEFHSNGTYTYEDGRGPDVTGTYSTSGDDLITKSDQMPNSVTRKFKLWGNDQLDITNPSSGVTGEYVRVK